MTSPWMTQYASAFTGMTNCGPNLTATLDVITKGIQNQLGFNEQAIFSLGDGVQRAVVNGVFDLFRLQTWSPDNILRLSYLAAQQLARTSELLTSPQAANLAWQELSNKVEVFILVSNLESILGLSPDVFLPLPELVERAYSLPAFEALWAVEGMGNYYANLYWSRYGAPQSLLLAENAQVPEKSLLMLHAGMGLAFAHHLLGRGSPFLIPDSPPNQFLSVVEEFVRLARNNAREGYLGPVIESLGLVTRDFYPEMVGSIDRALRQAAPDLLGYYWHGIGRALYFSRRYFLPVLSTVWTGVDNEAETAPERENAMAGLTWAVALVNMRQPDIMEAALHTYVESSPLQNAFANGIASSLMMRHDTTPEAPFISSFCQYQPANPQQSQLWQRLITKPCEDALNHYYPVLRDHAALGEMFRYQDLAKLVARLEPQPGNLAGVGLVRRE
ncbi:MAG TPA: hypothetical protein VFR24_18930 [Candidatus Angelobacter sp.]|nr:hypothetical protein [Candidatus Angelobacter sp.]